MALFQKSVLNKHLNHLDESKVAAAYAKYQENYNPQKIEQIKQLKEEEYQDGFLRDIFVDVFGYTLRPEENYNLQREFKNQNDGKKADGAILKDDKALAIIELKSTNTKDLTKVTNQAFNYKNNQPECKYVITSNFQKLRFYIDYAHEYEEFNLFNLQKDEFKLLYLILHKDNLLADVPLQIKKETKFHEQDVSSKLYKDYSSFKRKLFENLVKNQPDIDQLELFKKSQKLLDRFLFILFSEDSGLLPPNLITTVITKYRKLDELDYYQPLYDIFKQYFGYINNGDAKENISEYNGGLFKADVLLDNLIIDDSVLINDLMKLSIYDFNTEVDVNILGHIFEHSLNEIEEITAQIQGTATDKNKSKRKKDGVFYTPKYITHYIVDNTVGTLCNEKRIELGIDEIEFDGTYRGKNGRLKQAGKKLFKTLNDYKDWLLSLKILDPACGSGAFLNQALIFLIAEHKNIDDILEELTGHNLPLFDTDKSILEHNLFGVDINEESVEIAQLSLWLRTAKKGRKLSSLNNNIKCGNSLIDDVEVAGDKAFDWNVEFKEIMDNGGFDVVIGNPPYVDIKGLERDIVKYIFKEFESANSRVNLYSTFIEKSIGLMRNHGYSSFIIPSSLLTQDSYKPLRKILLNNTTIKNIVRLPNESFGGSAGEVKVDTIILTYKSDNDINAEAEIIVYKGFDRIEDISRYNSDLYFSINPTEWQKDENFLFRINVDTKILELLDKCKENTKKLINCADFCLGLTPYDKYKGHTQEQIKSRAFHSSFQQDESFKKLLAGNDIRKYSVQWGGKEWISYGNWLGAPREKRFFTSKRILVKQIIDWSDKRIWAALTDEELYNTQNAFNIIADKEYLHEYLIAIINSKLMSFYHRKQFLEEFKDRFQKILIKDAKEFPIKIQTIESQNKYVDLVNLIIKFNKQLQQKSQRFINRLKEHFGIEKISKKLNSFYDFDFKTLIAELKKQKITLSLIQQDEWEDYFTTYKTEINHLQTQITQTDNEIDAMVYELYGLTNEEIAIVEGAQ